EPSRWRQVRANGFTTGSASRDEARGGVGRIHLMRDFSPAGIAAHVWQTGAPQGASGALDETSGEASATTAMTRAVSSPPRGNQFAALLCAKKVAPGDSLFLTARRRNRQSQRRANRMAYERSVALSRRGGSRLHSVEQKRV